MPNVIENRLGVRKVPWNSLGQTIDNAPTSDRALELSGLNWSVESTDVYVNGLIVPKVRANVRADDNSVLGIVSDRYRIVQNKDAFSFIDSLIDSGDVRYEKAGSLKNGRVVWMLARLNQETNILGDKVDPYICFTNTHDGSGSVRIMMTPIRVICANMLNIALNSASRQWSATHVGDFERKLEDAQKTLLLANNYLTALDEEAHKMVDIKISDTVWEEFVHELLPETPTTSLINLENRRDELRSKLLADDIRKFNGTGWAVVNAVTDYVAHTLPIRVRSNYKENRFGRIIQGDAMVDKVVELLRQVA